MLACSGHDLTGSPTQPWLADRAGGGYRRDLADRAGQGSPYCRHRVRQTDSDVHAPNL